MMGALIAACVVGLYEPGPVETAGDQAVSTTSLDELTCRLQQFTRNAIKEGLLTPVEPGDSSGPALPEGPVQLSSPAICPESDPLDFSAYRDLRDYEQIVAIREAVAGRLSEGSPNYRVALARAYLAAGMDAEASLLLGDLESAEARALRSLAGILGAKSLSAKDELTLAAQCHGGARLWMALAGVQEGDLRGALLVAESVGEIRSLPFHLRVRAVSIAVPALAELGEIGLASTLLATFHNEERTDVRALQFLDAIVALARSESGAEARVREFLVEHQWRESALAALVRHGGDLPDVYATAVLGNLTRLDASMRFALQEWGDASDYSSLLALASDQSIVDDTARRAVVDQIFQALERDLEADDPLRSIAAISALEAGADQLAVRPEAPELYTQAADQALSFGFAKLSDSLVRAAPMSEQFAERRAALARRQRDPDTVYSMAARFPENPQIGVMAVLAAIEAGDEVMTRAFETRLEFQPQTIAAMLEQEALSGRAVVSPQVYSAANEAPEGEYSARIKRAMRLLSDETSELGQVNVAHIPEMLERARTALQEPEQETVEENL